MKWLDYFVSALLSTVMIFTPKSKSSGNTGTTTNATTAYVDPIQRQSTGEEVYFFAHGDWGKGGYDGSYSDHRRLPANNMAQNHENHEGGEGEGEGEHEHEEREEEALMQGKVADAMNYVANYTKPEFVLALGDNFYTDGVSSTNDSMWNSHFRDVYFGHFDTLKGVPWHAAIGNHDLGYGEQGVQAQINRTYTDTADDDGVWQMPGQFYTVKYNITGGGYVQVVVVDTTWLSPSENGATNTEGGISTDTQAARIYAQLSVLYEIFQDTLTRPRPTWLLVAGHYPVYSQGEKGDNDELISYLLPFMQHYGVHAYLCGHDHINEHLQADGVEYFVAGASTMSNTLTDDFTSYASLAWAGESYSAFARFTATRDELSVDYVSTDQETVYSYTMYNPNEYGNIGLIGNSWSYLKLNPAVSCAALLGVSFLIGVWMQKASMDRHKLRNTPHLHRLHNKKLKSWIEEGNAITPDSSLYRSAVKNFTSNVISSDSYNPIPADPYSVFHIDEFDDYQGDDEHEHEHEDTHSLSRSTSQTSQSYNYTSTYPSTGSTSSHDLRVPSTASLYSDPIGGYQRSFHGTLGTSASSATASGTSASEYTETTSTPTEDDDVIRILRRNTSRF